MVGVIFSRYCMAGRCTLDVDNMVCQARQEPSSRWCKRLIELQVSTQLYVNAASSNRCNRYLTYLTNLPRDKQELTWHISNDIKEAMSVFIHTCLGRQTCKHCILSVIGMQIFAM